MIIPQYNLKGFAHNKYNIELHPVKKVEEALRALFG
jgi:DNA repair protein RadA/Sms